MASPPTRTKAERVFELLRGQILSGQIAPGTRLRYAELSERYETSTGVLREAMLRLSEQGLVKGEPQQGFQVVDLTIEDLKDLTDARIMLETLALRSALADGDVEWESRIIAAHHRLSRTPLEDPDDTGRLHDEWVAEHAAFHKALLDGCANRRLKEIASSLSDAAELYRRWSLPLGKGADRKPAEEHEALLAASLARDADLACELLTAHINRTASILFESVVSRPAES
jgi:DNA-binding GntR family transcriptional regulator